MENEFRKNQNPNHLINEKSPYLQQHAYNPVDWYPWGVEAFKLASALDKPILLSIGYSTCHWCHVMENESFEDEDVASLLNRTFVCIKVDREERPDVDSIYMHFCQATTGSGGWPLNVILTPDRKPIFAMTYMPKTTRRGIMGITEMANSIQELWSKQRSELIDRSDSVMDALRSHVKSSRGSNIPGSILKEAFESFKNSYDAENGGFGSSPKFPSPHDLIFLLRYYKSQKDQVALEMAEKTLLKMRQGGIFDQVGYGFHRYSTDPFWTVPHFEKMLYDQAMLMWAYSEAFLVTGKEFYKTVVEEIYEFLQNEMQNETGLFNSAIDADSEGVEGKYYLWRRSEIARLIPEKVDTFSEMFNVEDSGNFNVSEGNAPSPDNILYVSGFSDSDATRMPWKSGDYIESLHALRDERKKRIKPAVDKKILTDINSLLAFALFRSASALKKEEYKSCALKILEFIRQNMIKNGGIVSHSYIDGEVSLEGFLDDYSFLTAALIEAFQSTGEEHYLSTAIEIQNHLFLHYEDDNGGFFLAADYEKANILRIKPDMDGAIPSGNSFQVFNLVNLSQILEDDSYLQKAESIPLSLANSLSSVPRYHSLMICAIEYLSRHFAVRQSVYGDDTFDSYSAIVKGYRPEVVFVPVRSGETYVTGSLDEISKSTNLRHGKFQVCSGKECYLPVDTLEDAMRSIDTM